MFYFDIAFLRWLDVRWKLDCSDREVKILAKQIFKIYDILPKFGYTFFLLN